MDEASLRIFGHSLRRALESEERPQAKCQRRERPNLFESPLVLKRIDAYAKRLEDQTPGLKLARADAVRILLVRGLAEVEGPEASRKQRA